MSKLFRPLPLLALLASAIVAHAQEVITGPLPHDPSRTALVPLVAQRTTTVTLPFFDDFTTPREGAPNPSKWLATGGVLVNNRLAVSPLTRGAATLDGLQANGSPYGGPAAYGYTDFLTSQPIDLSAGGSNIFLSFALQQGSVVGPAQYSLGSRPVDLALEFLDNNGRWQNQATYAATGVVTPFQQKIVPITNSAYFHSAFQFRFRNRGNMGTSRDAWSVDYILLDRNRFNPNSPTADTIFQDIATSRTLSSPLRRFRAMPWWQYNAATNPPDELNPNLDTDIITLEFTSPRPINRIGTVRDLNSNFTATWQTPSPYLVVPTPRQQPIPGSARTAPIPLTAAAKLLRYTLALTTNEPAGARTLPNDTTYRDAELSNYYAYDDGTAERFFAVQAASSGPMIYTAYRFDLNKPDQVRGLLVAPVFDVADNGGNRNITIAIWNDNGSGQPSNTPLATATGILVNPLPAGQTFYEVRFPTSIPVSGTFYIGYGQPANGNILPYGLDLNNAPPSNTLFISTLGAWSAYTINPTPGSLMMRPVMTNNVTVTGTRNTAESTVFSTYPNPGHGSITVAGPAFAQASVLDMLGRSVWTQPANQAGQHLLALDALPPGLYLLRLALADGSTATRRIVLE